MSSVPRRGLGRGFEVLIGGTAVAREPQRRPRSTRTRSQPRQQFDGEAVSGLAESIRAQGLIQPVVVRPRLEGGYELIAGERRWRAAREAGLETVPAVVREADDRDTLLLGLVENVAREDLSPVEEARAYALLLDEFGLALAEVAERVGKSKPTVSNRVRLLELPDDVLAMVDRARAHRRPRARGARGPRPRRATPHSLAASCATGCRSARPNARRAAAGARTKLAPLDPRRPRAGAARQGQLADR